MSTLITPVHPAQGDENKIRLIAFCVLLLVVLYWLSGSVAIPALLVIDFALRSFNMRRWSPLAINASWIAPLFYKQGRPVYMPPKLFAARIGLVFSIAMLTLHLLHQPIYVWTVSAVLAFFAALEAFIGFCAGCYAFDFLRRLKR